MSGRPIPAPSVGMNRIAEIALAIAVVSVIALLVVPLPALLLDLFLALSIGLSLVVLLVALYTVNPLDFSSFRRSCCCSRCCAWR
jgi:flagellar biosynthesis protein FlhA